MRQKEFVMNEEVSNPAGKGLARRRLLRGTFAAPAVLTLVSGSALAATSLSCVAKQNEPGHAVNAGGNPDGTVWVRVPVWEKKKPTDPLKLARFVSGSDIASLLPPGGTYLTAGNWQCTSNTFNTNPFIVGQIYTTAQADAIRNYTMTKVPNLYVAVRIDATGRIVGVESISTANSAMHVSCWTSFGGANPFKV
jgi:hypothetical protein